MCSLLQESLDLSKAQCHDAEREAKLSQAQVKRYETAERGLRRLAMSIRQAAAVQIDRQVRHLSIQILS